MPPVIQIPPGVDTAAFSPLHAEERGSVRESLGLDANDFLISSYSRLVPRKGMDTLIKATVYLRDLSDLRLAIGGSGRDRERLEKLSKKLKAPVTFLGRVSDDLLSPWLGASDLMVMDCRSRWFGLEQEGFGIVFMEAAASGVAQIAGRSGGSHEAVIDGETGLVVSRSRSPKALAIAIRELYEDTEKRQAFALRSREVAVERFEWDILAKQLGDALSFYDQPLGEESAREDN
jgi:phosphatidylinositol alpha-1,6-mannosyltransferase